MKNDLDLADDFEMVYANQERIKFACSTRKGEGMGNEDLIPYAKRRAITTRQLMAANGAYTGADINWWFPAKHTAANIIPKPGDIITDEDDVAWTVLEVGHGKFKQTWRCVCRNLAIAYDLRDLITIERAATGIDATGSPTRTWATLYRNVSAKVQPTEATIREDRGIKGQERAYTVVVARQLHLLDLKECRLTWTTSRDRVDKYLDMTSYKDAEMITELPKIEAVLRF